MRFIKLILVLVMGAPVWVWADSSTLAEGLRALEEKRYNEARTKLEAALAQDPTADAALYGLAMLFEKDRDQTRARRMWERLLSQTRDDSLREMAQRHLERLTQ